MLGTLSYQWARKYLKLYATVLHHEMQRHTVQSVYRVQIEVIDQVVAQMIAKVHTPAILQSIDHQLERWGKYTEGLAAARIAALSYAREVIGCIPLKEET